MKRFAVAAVAATLALPASAMAASTNSGIVLSVAGHDVQVVNSAHQVSSYLLRHRITGLRRGSKISFSASHGTIAAAKVLGATKTVTFLGKVVSNGAGGVRLRLGDGNTVAFSTRQIAGRRRTQGHHVQAAFLPRSAGGISITLNAPPGTTVLVTETIESDGTTSITITIDPGASIGSGSGNGSGSGSGGGSGGGSGASGNDLIAKGVVTDIENDNFGIVTNDGTVIRFQMDAADLANEDMNPCDIVDVSYYEDSVGDLVAASINDYASSDAGACDSDGTFYPTDDETGPITAISSTGITIDTSDQGSMTFPVNTSMQLTEGFLLGDVVDVTYEPVPDGTNYVTDIEYVENDSTGVVTSLSPGSITIIDDSTNQSDVFTADPRAGMFLGIGLGDEVDVTWHQGAHSMVADNVDDNGSAGGFWVRRR